MNPLSSSTWIIITLSLGLLAAGHWGAKQKHGKERLETNQAILLEKQREYILRDSMNALSIGVLTLKTEDFAKNFSEIKELVRDMGIRLRRIENLSQNSMRSDYALTTPVRDTVVVIDSSRMAKGSTIAYKDRWIELNGTIIENMFNGSVVTYDTITQVVHRVPKRFLFFRYGTKELRQEVVCANPHTRLTYSRSLKIVK